MSKTCKILCAKCGKPLLYDWRDIVYSYRDSNDSSAHVSVPCTRKGCKYRNKSALFDELFLVGYNAGKSSAKREIRGVLGITEKK
jgi:hypothetical protein